MLRGKQSGCMEKKVKRLLLQKALKGEGFV